MPKDLVTTGGKCFTCGEASEVTLKIDKEEIPFCKLCLGKYGSFINSSPNWKKLLSSIAQFNAERDYKAGFKVLRKSHIDARKV